MILSFIGSEHDVLFYSCVGFVVRGVFLFMRAVRTDLNCEATALSSPLQS